MYGVQTNCFPTLAERYLIFAGRLLKILLQHTPGNKVPASKDLLRNKPAVFYNELNVDPVRYDLTAAMKFRNYEY